jgi:hypothetical protein
MIPRVTLFVLCAGCTPLGGKPGGPDLLNGRLTRGTNLCTYEEVAPDFPPPDDSGNWMPDWERSPYLACADGLFAAVYSVFESETGTEFGLSVDVQLYEVVEPFAGWQKAQVVDPLEGLDDCEVIEHGPTGTQPMMGEVVWQDAPTVTLDAGDWSQALTDYNPDAISRTYSAWLADGLPPEEATFDLWVEGGGAAPALDLDALGTMPPNVVVSTPSLAWGAELPRADVPFAWSGTSEDVLYISLWVRSEFNVEAFPMYEVNCEVVDDGSWVLPGSILETMPEGWSAYVDVQRRSIAWVGTVEGRALRSWTVTRHAGANVLLGQ